MIFPRNYRFEEGGLLHSEDESREKWKLGEGISIKKNLSVIAFRIKTSVLETKAVESSFELPAKSPILLLLHAESH